MVWVSSSSKKIDDENEGNDLQDSCNFLCPSAFCTCGLAVAWPLHFRFACMGVAQELEAMNNLNNFKTYFDSTWMRGWYSLPHWNCCSYMMAHIPTIA